MTEEKAREGFDIDLEFGKSREDAFENVLKNEEVEGVTIEHKADEKARQTGNVFIEYKQKIKGEWVKSGLSVTTADYWAIEYYDNCWVFLPTEKLRKIAIVAYNDDRKIIGGDYNNYKGVLVPIDWLVDYNKIEEGDK